MEECHIKFPGPISKKTVTYLVIDYLKYILYYRGQFPLPLEQLKQLQEREAESSKTSRLPDVDGHFIYSDDSDLSICRSVIPNRAHERARQKFYETVSKFNEFFNELTRILETKNVLEIVLNLGSNMMNPKELYHIRLPLLCSSDECAIDYASLQSCKMQFFRSIMSSDIWTDLKSDCILPISVLLLLGKDVTLDDRMELKHFYALPRNCKRRTVFFTDKCSHVDETSLELQSFENISISNNFISNSRNPGHWVKIKPDLKGFKSY